MKKIFFITGLILFGLSSAFSQSQLIEFKSIDAGAYNAVPIVNYSDLVTYGIGLHGGVDLALGITDEESFLSGFTFSPDLAVSYEFPKISNISLLIDLLWQIEIGYEFEFIPEKLFFAPGLVYGGLVHIADGAPGFGIYYDSTMGATLNISYKFSDNLGVYLSPAYQFFLEDSDHGQQILIPAGIRVYL